MCINYIKDDDCLILLTLTMKVRTIILLLAIAHGIACRTTSTISLLRLSRERALSL